MVSRTRKARIRVVSLALIAVLFPISASARNKSAERIDIDPVLRGVWMIHATSNDRGTTIAEVSPPEALCRVTAASVRYGDGRVLRVEKVLIIEDDNGNPANTIGFDNGVIWIVSKQPGQRFVLVQVFADGKKESLRVLVTVEQ
jgi:hypothetical protein